MENLISINEAATTAGVSRQTIWTWCWKHKLGRQVGTIWLVDEEKLKKHMEKRKNAVS